MAHLQSKMRSVASSFQSLGMLIVDEEAASHWAHDRLLGDLMCPASWLFWVHDAGPQCLLGSVPLCAPCVQTDDLRPCGVIGHQLARGSGGRCATGASAGGRQLSTGKVPELIAR